MSKTWKRFGVVASLALMAAGLIVSPAAAQDSLGGRPVLPDEQTAGSEHFLVHYTQSGDQAVEAVDQDANGIPDFVDKVVEVLEYAWEIEVNVMGWAPPPQDRGEGGDTRIDVYLDNIMNDGYAGYVDNSGGHIGDNPLTPEVERHAAYSYMVLDNDYDEVRGAGVEITPVEALETTVAHEFNHVIQGGYDDVDPHFWLYEATSTWMEGEVYSHADDRIYYLDDLFSSPDTCLVAEANWYADWLFLQLIAERYGPETVRAIWEHSRQLNGFNAIDAALSPFGSSLKAEARDFGVANLLRAYEQGSHYPTIQLEGSAGIGVYTPPDGVQSLGNDYIRLEGSGLLAVTPITSSTTLSVRAVGVVGDSADVIDMMGDRLIVDTAGYQEIYVVVHNSELVGFEVGCVYADYRLDIEPASGPASPVAETWSAAQFEQPSDQPPSDGSMDYQPPSGAPFAGGEFASAPDQLDVSFQVLVPASLPPGYAFDYAYIMTAAELGQSADYYVPGGGESANMDYLDQGGHWLGIAESPSPYSTLQEWLDDIDYDPQGDFQIIMGVEVLIEDLSDGAEAWFSATFIVNELFVVVDSDSSRDDLIQLVEGLIEAAAAPVDAPAASPQAPTPDTGLQPLPDGSGDAAGVEAPSDAQIDEARSLARWFGMGLCLFGGCVVAGLVSVGVLILVTRVQQEDPPGYYR